MNNSKFQNDFLKGVITKDISKDILDEMIPIGELSSSQVMEVYQNDYRARLQEVLGDNYEACWFVLGDEDFLNYSYEYVEANPSSFTNLLHYGDDFPEFLAKKAHDVSFIKDLAEFERAFWHLFHQKDCLLSFDPQKYGEAIFEQRLKLIPNSYFLFESDVELSQLWQMRKGDVDKSFNEIQNKEYTLLYKNHERVQIQILSEGLYLLLRNLEKSQTILEAVEGIEEEKLSDPAIWSIFFGFISYISKIELK